jgi:hypothetical protein
MRKIYLTIIVFFLDVLRNNKVIKNVWYASELELNRIKAHEMAEWFEWHANEPR